MNRRRARAAVWTMVLGAAAMAACALDFDRYAPAADGGADEVGPTEDVAVATDVALADDVGSPTDAIALSEATSRADVSSGVDGAPTTDSAPVDGRLADVSADAGRADAGACAPVASCFQQATTCGATCGQEFQVCQRGCFTRTCMQACTTTEQSCLGTCATTCIGCEQEGGCPAQGACLDASHA